jgi:putative glycosyltransferase
VLSVVTTLYNSAGSLEEFFRRVSAEAARISEHVEFILVNDGSPDCSLEVALMLLDRDPRVRIVDLSRNFGQHKAIMAGLDHAKGDLVFLLDCDLEEDPELLGRFHAELLRRKADVVYGVQQKRQGSLFKRLSGYLFYKLFDWLSAYPVPANPFNARLMTRRYVDSLLLHKEREMYLAGLWAITGYEQVAVPAVKHSRGRSSYGVGKRISLTVNAITAFSSRPLYFVFYFGALIMAVSGLGELCVLVQSLLVSAPPLGWPSLILSVWLLGGINLFCMGILSIYLSKTFIETKQRPYTIVRSIHERRDGAAASPVPSRRPNRWGRPRAA